MEDYNIDIIFYIGRLTNELNNNYYFPSYFFYFFI